MAIKNKSRYAILGILNIASASGYDIKKYCDTVISGIWNENFGHIYPTLKGLEQDGMIYKLSNEEESRKVLYGITQQGKEELMTWLQEETLPQPVRSEFMLKFLFSNQLPKDRVIEMLKEYEKLMEEKLALYLQHEKDLDKGVKEISSERLIYLRATLRKGIIAYQGTIQWCQETLDEFDNR